MKVLKKVGIILLCIIIAAVVILGIWGWLLPTLKVNKLEQLSMEDSVTAQYSALLDDEDTIYSYAEDLYNMGARRPGTEAGDKAQAYVKDKFTEFGLADVDIIPSQTKLYTCDNYSLAINGDSKDCCYINYSACDLSYGSFDTGNVEAEMVYVGTDTAGKEDVEGKIVVADITFQSLPYVLGNFIGDLVYDPNNTLGLFDTKDVVYMGDSFTDSYFYYQSQGAVGYIGILDDYYDSPEYYSEDYTYYGTMEMPGGVFCQLYSSEDFQTLYEMNNYLPDEYVYPTAPVVDEDGDGEYWDEIPLDLDGDGDFLDDYNYPEDPNDQPQYADGNTREHIYYLATYEHQDNVPYNTLGPLAEYIDTDVTLGSGEHEYTINAYEASPAAFIEGIMDSGIAVYNHGSWMDTFITGTTELYNTMEETNPSKMVIDPGYHETESPFWSYCGEDESSSIKAYAIELVRYYDRYLKGIENGIDTEAPVYIYNMNGDGWRAENEFPLARQVETDYYLGQDGILTTDSESVEDGSDNYAVDLTQDSSYSSQWYDYGVSRYMMAAPDEVPDRTEKDENCLTYTTSAFTEDTEVTGYPIINFYASSTSDDADFYVFLEDVDEDGNAILVTEGVLAGGFAKTYDNDTMILGGSTGIDVLPNLPWHGYEKEEYDSAIFADGSIVEYEIDLFPTSWTFKEGHSLRISIACANTPTFATNEALTDDTVVTFYRSEEYPSKITLPVIPD